MVGRPLAADLAYHPARHLTTIILLTVLSTGSILNAGFERYSTFTVRWYTVPVISSTRWFTGWE